MCVIVKLTLMKNMTTAVLADSKHEMKTLIRATNFVEN